MAENKKESNQKEDNIDLEATQTEQEQEQSISSDDILKAKDEKISQLEKELALAKKNESEAMIRARAEIDNVRKRVEQDIEKAHKFALEKFSTELLEVIDNLERALATLDKENDSHKATIEGIELTLKSFLDTMKKFGVEVVKSTGEILNPEYHQAVTMIDSPDHKSNQIVDTMQKGYTLNGRLIRPAMVIVAK